MDKEYFTLPMPFSKILKREEIIKCDLKKSIEQKIHLLLISNFGENRFNPQFGCIIWEYDFENVANQNAWKDMIVNSVKETLQLQEQRLQNIKVKFDINEQEFVDEKDKKVIRVKRKLDVTVTANLVKTNERFHYNQTIFISPISLD
jgi:phage baseplate assembly protein W